MIAKDEHLGRILFGLLLCVATDFVRDCRAWISGIVVSGSCTKAWLLLRRPCCCSLLGLVSSPHLVWVLDAGIRCTPPRQVVFFLAGGEGLGRICISQCMPVVFFNKLRTESIIGPRRPVKCLGGLGFFFLSNFGALECSLEQLGEYICAAVL